MVIHGNKDSKIDFYDNKGALESIGREITEVYGAEHGFHEALFENEVSEAIAKFFSNPTQIVK
jgi:hypothetical protein